MPTALLPPDLTDVFDRLYSVERAAWDDQFPREVSSTTSQLAAKGMLQSSVAVRMLVDLGAAAISVRAHVAFRLMTRCLAAHGKLPGREAVNLVVDILASYIQAETSKIREHLIDAPSMRGSMQDAAAKVLPRLEQTALQEISRVTGEMQLLAVASERTSAPSTSPITIHGPVGLVQTGAGSIGVAVQHLDQGARDAIRKALDKISDDLAAVGSEAPFNATDISEMVAESRSELDKPKPNLPRLTAVLTGIGNTISFVPKLRTAYDTLKWALAFIGVSLPG
jgi:hypothetical protein